MGFHYFAWWWRSTSNSVEREVPWLLLRLGGCPPLHQSNKIWSASRGLFVFDTVIVSLSLHPSVLWQRSFAWICISLVRDHTGYDSALVHFRIDTNVFQRAMYGSNVPLGSYYCLITSYLTTKAVRNQFYWQNADQAQVLLAIMRFSCQIISHGGRQVLCALINILSFPIQKLRLNFSSMFLMKFFNCSLCNWSSFSFLPCFSQCDPVAREQSMKAPRGQLQMSRLGFGKRLAGLPGVNEQSTAGRIQALQDQTQIEW